MKVLKSSNKCAMLKGIPLFLMMFLAWCFASEATAGVRLLSQNIRCGYEGKKEELILPIKERIERLADLIYENEVDVIFLQENCESKNFSPVEYLSQALRVRGTVYNFVFKTFIHRAYNLYDESIVVMSRHFPLYAQARELPDSQLGRAFQYLKLSSLDITLVNTHLNHLDDEGQERSRQLQLIIQHLGNRQIFLAGDLNSGPVSPETNIARQAGFKSCYGGATWPAHAPRQWLDGAWIRHQNMQNLKCELVSSIGSDHLGVLFDLSSVY